MIAKEYYKARGFTRAKIQEIYFHEVSKSEFISQEEEIALGKRILRRDGQAVNRLTESHLVFVVKLAHWLKHQGVEFMDLVQEGNLGLLTAAKKFDYRRGARFKTYAFHWIMQHMRRVIVKKKALVNPSVNDQLNRARVGKVLARAKHQGRGYLSEEEIARLSGLSVKDVKKGLTAKVLLFPILSQDEAHRTSDEQRGMTEESMAAPDDPSSEQGMLLRDIIKAFWELKREFTDQDLDIIHQHYVEGRRPGEIMEALSVTQQKMNQVLSRVKEEFQGLYIILERHFKEKDLTAVGRDYQVSRERIRQVQANTERDIYYYLTVAELEGEFSAYELDIFRRLHFSREKISTLAKENSLTSKEVKELKKRILQSLENRHQAKTS